MHCTASRGLVTFGVCLLLLLLLASSVAPDLNVGTPVLVHHQHATPMSAAHKRGTPVLQIISPSSAEGYLCPTKGLYGDEFNTGNAAPDPLKDIASVDPLPSHVAFYERSNDGPYASKIERATLDKQSPQCFYRVSLLCVKDGALYLVKPSPGRTMPKQGAELWPAAGTIGATSSSTSATLRLCNELRSKIHLRVYLLDSTAARAPAGFRYAGVGSKAHVTACWQYYGYHLIKCLTAAFAVQATHGLLRPLRVLDADRNVTLLLYNHAVSLPRESREHFSHHMYLGSSTRWDDPGPRAAPHTRPPYRAAPLWQLWSQSTASPTDVNEVFKFPVAGAVPGGTEGICFDRAIIGHPNHNAVHPNQTRAHTHHLNALLLPHCPVADEALPSSRRRIVIVQRGAGKNQGTRRFLNVPAMVGMLSAAYGNTTAVQVVDWASLSLIQQVCTAHNADIIIAMHGGGNAWIAAMRPRTVFIETWPQCVIRNVYLVMAQKHNVRFYALCLGLSESAPAGSALAKYGFLHRSVEVPLPQLRKVVDQALSYLDAVSGKC